MIALRLLVPGGQLPKGVQQINDPNEAMRLVWQKNTPLSQLVSAYECLRCAECSRRAACSQITDSLRIASSAS